MHRTIRRHALARRSPVLSLVGLCFTLAGCPSSGNGGSADSGAAAKHTGAAAGAGGGKSPSAVDGGMHADSGSGSASSSMDSGMMLDAGSAADSGASSVDAGSCMLPTADAGASCNTVENTATNITITAATGTMAKGMGGTIRNGTYFLSAVLTYPGSTLPDGTAIRQTLEVCNGTALLSENIADAAKSTHKNLTITPAGTVPNVDRTCSTKANDPKNVYSSYTATATSFTLYSTDGSFEMTFTRQ
jgi:hypothetical protein